MTTTTAVGGHPPPPQTPIYDFTEARKQHAVIAAALAVLLGVVLGLTVFLLILVRDGFSSLRLAALASLVICAVPFVGLLLPFAVVTWYLGHHFRPTAHLAALPTVPPIPTPTPQRDLAIIMHDAPPPYIPTTALPAPTVPALPPYRRPAPGQAYAYLVDPADPEPTNLLQFPPEAMPMSNLIDPRTNRADVTAADVDYFLTASEPDGAVGSPSLRAWKAAPTDVQRFPSGMTFTREYWDKLVSVAEAWGRLHRGKPGQPLRLIPAGHLKRNAGEL